MLASLDGLGGYSQRSAPEVPSRTRRSGGAAPEMLSRKELLFPSAAQTVSVPFPTRSLWQEARPGLIPALTTLGTGPRLGLPAKQVRVPEKAGSRLRCPL